MWYNRCMRNINDLKNKRSWGGPLLLVALGLAALAILIYQIPDVQARVNWRLEIVSTYINGVFNPVQPMPTPQGADATALAYDPGLAAPTPNSQAGAISVVPPDAPAATAIPQGSATATVVLPSPTVAVSPTLKGAVATATLVPTPIPARVMLPSPAWEKQDINNCGPASLTHYLRFYGWSGNQKDIAAVVKPNPDDRNINVDELVYYARTHTGWLNTEYRVGGNLELLKKLIAAGVPVMIEEGANNETAFFPNDDRWSGHYLFINGYDDKLSYFLSQDSWLGPDKQVPYASLDKNWQQFNRVYILIYPPDKAATVQAILGSDWDVTSNRQNALDAAKAETEKDPKNAFAWFNLGTNQTYFEQYGAAAKSYDTARALGLPIRMLRYQFGPFIAYFHTNRTDDLMALVNYALQITFNSEEAFLWKGWALYRLGRKADAIEAFNQAIKVHPGYGDALYALNFVTTN